MASEFVRKVKNVRNIDILSPNITTENDLISTIDGDVYVSTNKGYRRITGVETKEISQIKKDLSNLKIQSDTNTLTNSDNTDDIETNTTLINSLTTQLEELRNNIKQYYTLFNGSVNGVGSTIPLNDDLYSFDLIYISGEYPRSQKFTETIMVKEIINNISIQRINLRDTDGTFLGAYEIKLTPTSNNELEITNDVSWDELGSTGTGQDRNAYTITNIEGVK